MNFYNIKWKNTPDQSTEEPRYAINFWPNEMPKKKKPLIFCLVSSNRNILAEQKCQNRTALKLQNANLIRSR